MKEVKKRKHSVNFLLRVAVFVFSVYILLSLVSQQIEISKKRHQLTEVKQQIQIQEINNEDLKRALNTDGNKSEYIEREAREGLNYAKPGERVFINIAGN